MFEDFVCHEIDKSKAKNDKDFTTYVSLKLNLPLDLSLNYFEDDGLLLALPISHERKGH